jgi:hypothetical protein
MSRRAGDVQKDFKKTFFGKTFFGKTFFGKTFF